MFDFEMTELVTLMSLGDPRIAPADMEGFTAVSAFWFSTIGDLDPGDARDVILTHYRTALPTDQRLTPGLVLAGVEEARAARLQGVTDDDLMGGIDSRHPRYQLLWKLRRSLQMARPESTEAEDLAGQIVAAAPVTDEETAAMEAARRPRPIGWLTDERRQQAQARALGGRA